MYSASARGAETFRAILDCITVRGKRQYDALYERFARETADVQHRERIEIGDRFLLPDSHFIHDRFSMVIVRVRDEQGHPVEDVDLLLTGGREHDPNRLPRGFLTHSQHNRRQPGTVTYFFNHDVMTGCEAASCRGKIVREELPGVGMLGLKVQPRPEEGFVHYLPCELQASSALLASLVRPNRTTLVELVLRRVVREGVFRLDRGTGRDSFSKARPGPPIK